MTIEEWRRENRRRAEFDRPPNMLTSAEVSRITGASFRTLNHWIKAGYIEGQDVKSYDYAIGDRVGEGPGSGKRRYWTWMQVNRVRELVWLREQVWETAARYGVSPNFGGNPPGSRS